MDVTKELIERYHGGDHLSDQELEALLAFYTDLVAKLSLLGVWYYLATDNARRHQQALEGYHRARESHKAHQS